MFVVRALLTYNDDPSKYSNTRCRLWQRCCFAWDMETIGNALTAAAARRCRELNFFCILTHSLNCSDGFMASEQTRIGCLQWMMCNLNSLLFTPFMGRLEDDSRKRKWVNDKNIIFLLISSEIIWLDIQDNNLTASHVGFDCWNCCRRSLMCLRVSRTIQMKVKLISFAVNYSRRYGMDDDCWWWWGKKNRSWN